VQPNNGEDGGSARGVKSNIRKRAAARRDKALVKLIAGCDRNAQSQGPPRPDQTPMVEVVSTPGAKKQQRQNRVLGDVRSLANQEMDKCKTRGINAAEN